MVDNQDVDRTLGGQEFEKKLLFDGSEDGDDIRAALLRGDIVGPLEGDIREAGETRFVDYLAMDLIGKRVGEVGHRAVFGVDRPVGVFPPRARAASCSFVLGERELSAASRADKLIDRQVLVSRCAERWKRSASSGMIMAASCASLSLGGAPPSGASTLTTMSKRAELTRVSRDSYTCIKALYGLMPRNRLTVIDLPIEKSVRDCCSSKKTHSSETRIS